MKTMKKNLLVVAMMLITLIGYANENITSNIDARKVKVEFKAVLKGNSITIKDENGTTLYSEDIKISGNFSKIFDLTALQDGNYIAELNKDFEVITKPFKVHNNLVSFSSIKEKKIYKPVVRIEEDLMLISKLSFEKEPLDITIYHNDTVIHSETVTADTNMLKKVYRLSLQETGDYRVVLNTNDKMYIENFKL